MADEKVTIQLDAEASRLLVTLSQVEGGFKDIERIVKQAVRAALPDLNEFAEATKKLSNPQVFDTATKYARAVEKIGGAAKLSAPDLAKVNIVLSEANDRYNAIGETAPEAFYKLRSEVAQATTALEGLGDTSKSADANLRSSFEALTSGLQAVGNTANLDELTKSLETTITELDKAGGVSKLTSEEQRALADSVLGAITQYQALGAEVPDALAKVSGELTDLVTAQNAAAESATAISAAVDTVVDAFETMAETGTDLGAMNSGLEVALDNLKELGGVSALTQDQQESLRAAVLALGEQYEELGADVPTELRDVESALEDLAKTEEEVAKSAVTLEDALKQVSDSTEEAKDGADNAKYSLSQMFLAMAGGATAGELAADAIKNVAGAAKDVLLSVPRMVEGFAEVADGLRDMSLRTGVSVETLSKFRYVAGQTGTSVEALARVTQDLGRRISEASPATTKAIRELAQVSGEASLSFEALKASNPEEQLLAVFRALKEVDDQGKRTELGVKLLGGRFRMMANVATEDLGELLARAKELGLEFGKDSADAADKFNDSLDEMHRRVESVKFSIGNSLLPVAQKFVDVTGPVGNGALFIGSSFASVGKELLGSASTIGALILSYNQLKQAAPGESFFSIATAGWGKITTAIGTARVAAMGFLAANAPIIAGIAAITAALAIGYQAWKLWGEHAERAAAQAKQAVVDSANLERLNKAMGTSFKDINEATAAFLKLNNAKLATLPKVEAKFKDLQRSVDDAAAAYDKLSAAQKRQLADALKDPRNKEDIQTQWGVSPEVIARAEQLKKISDEQRVADTQLAAARAQRGKTGVAAAQAQIAAELALAKVQADLLPAEERAAKITQAEKKAAEDRAKIAYDTQKQANQELAALDTERRVYRIGEEHKGLQAQLLVIQERLKAEVRALEESGDAEAEIRRKTALAVQKSQLEADKLLAQTREEGRKRDIELAKETAALQIRLTKEGTDEQLALLALDTQARIDAATERMQIEGTANEELEKEITRIRTEAANQQREILVNKAKEEAEAIRAVRISLAEERIADEKSGMERELALADLRFQEEWRQLIEQGKSTAALEEKHQAELAKIRRKGDTETIAGLRAIADEARENYDKLRSKAGASFKAIEEARRKWEAAEVAAARTSREAALMQLGFEKQRLADMEARRKAGELVTQAEIDQQKRIVEEANRAAGQIHSTWSGLFGSLGAIVASFGDAVGGQFGAISKQAGALIATLSSTGLWKGGFAGSAVGQAKQEGGMAAAVGVGGVAVMQGIGQVGAATNQWGRGNRILGGAGAGAQAGAAFGPYGAIVGAGIGAIVGALRKPDSEKVFEDVGRRYGTKISEGLAKELSEQAKSKFKGSHQAAEIFNLDKIIGEAGGLSQENVGKFTKNLKDVFVLLSNGQMTVEQTRQVLEKNFGAFAQQLVDSGDLASKEFRDIIKLNREMGVESKEIAAFIEGAAQQAGGAIQAMIGGFAEQNKQLIELGQKRKELAELDKQTGGGDQAARKKLVEEIAALESKTADAGKKAGEDLDRLSRLAAASFATARREGLGMVDAVKAMGDTGEQLSALYDALGREKTPALQEFLDFQQKVKDNSGLLAATDATNELMKALSYMGGLTAETFEDLQQEALRNHEQLIEAGFSEREALEAQKEMLEGIIQAHKDQGLPIDEGTKKLIEQAQAQGVLKKEALDTNSIMVEGFAAIIEAVGGKLPDAFKKFRDKAREESQGVAKDLKDAVQDGADMVQKKLSGTEWEKWAVRGGVAGHLAKRALDETAGAAGTIDEKLTDIDWERWAHEAEEAAQRAKDAVNTVSYGSSPGGIKEIPLKLMEAIKATRVFTREFSGQMRSAKRAADQMQKIAPQFEVPQMAMNQALTAVSRGPEGAMAAADPRALKVQQDIADKLARIEALGPSMNIEFNATTLDATGLRSAVEKQILPMAIDALRRGVRGTRTDLKNALDI